MTDPPDSTREFRSGDGYTVRVSTWINQLWEGQTLGHFSQADVIRNHVTVKHFNQPLAALRARVWTWFH